MKPTTPTFPREFITPLKSRPEALLYAIARRLHQLDEDVRKEMVELLSNKSTWLGKVTELVQNDMDYHNDQNLDQNGQNSGQNNHQNNPTPIPSPIINAAIIFITGYIRAALVEGQDVGVVGADKLQFRDWVSENTRQAVLAWVRNTAFITRLIRPVGGVDGEKGKVDGQQQQQPERTTTTTQSSSTTTPPQPEQPQQQPLSSGQPQYLQRQPTERLEKLQAPSRMARRIAEGKGGRKEPKKPTAYNELD